MFLSILSHGRTTWILWSFHTVTTIIPVSGWPLLRHCTIDHTYHLLVIGVEDRVMLGHNMVCVTTKVVELIMLWIKIIQERQKSQVDGKCKQVQFYVCDLVYVKVSLTHEMMKFGLMGRLKPRYMGPYPIIETIERTTYHVKQHESMATLHYILMLRRVVIDLLVVMEYDHYKLMRIQLPWWSQELILDMIPRPITAISQRWSRYSEVRTPKMIPGRWSPICARNIQSFLLNFEC